MSLCLIAVIKDSLSSKSIKAYRFLDTKNNQMADQPEQNVRNVLYKYPNALVGLKMEDGMIKGSNGSLDRYPLFIQSDMSKVVNKSIVILFHSQELKECIISLPNGKLKRLKDLELIQQITASNGMIANGKIVSNYISAIQGEFMDFPQDAMLYSYSDEAIKKIEERTRVNSKAADKEEDINSIEVQNKIKHFTKFGRPRIFGARVEKSRLKELDVNGVMLEDKLVYALMCLRTKDPLMYVTIESMSKIESEEVPTMGVTDSQHLYFNSSFLSILTKGEATYILCHEAEHILMNHHGRCGNRDNEIWNMACDFYINKSLNVRFGIKTINKNKPSLEPVVYSRTVMSDAYYVQFPEGGLYEDTVDLEKDTPESIYEELIKSIKTSDGGGSGQEQNTGQNGQGGGSQGNNQEQNNQNGQQQSEQQQGGQENQGNQDEGQGNQNGSQGGQGKQQRQQKGQGGQGQGGQGQQRTVTFRGKEYPVRGGQQGSGKEMAGDLVDDPSSAKNKTEADQKYSSMAARIAVRLKKHLDSMHKSYAELSKGDMVLRMFEMLNAPKIDWKNIVRNRLVKASQKVNSFSSPDRRFVYRNMILPGPKKDEPNELGEILVFVDTSGSIGQDELGVCLVQLGNLIKKYKGEATLRFWDTEVGKSEFKIRDFKDVLKVKPEGGGGTDPNCIFEFLLADKRMKYNLPNLIIIFSDGYFGKVREEYRKRFEKSLVWVIDLNSVDKFEAPFGVVAPMNPDDSYKVTGK